MKTSLHLIKHIIRRHSKRDWGKHYVDFQKETRDISHGQSTSMSSTHTHSFCYKHSQKKDTADYKSQQDAHKQRNSHWRCSCLHHKTQTVLQRVHQRTFGFQNKHIWSDTCAEKNARATFILDLGHNPRNVDFCHRSGAFNYFKSFSSVWFKWDQVKVREWGTLELLNGLK